MSGSISVKYKENKGSIFTFTINMNSTDIKIHENNNTSTCLNKLKALIVDENAIRGAILKHYFDGWQIKHNEASSAEKALQQLQSAANKGKPFELAYIDIDIPEMGGLMLAQAIKDNSEINGTKCIIIKDASINKIIRKEKLKSAGISGYINRPYKSSALLDMTLQALELQQPLELTSKNIVSKIPPELLKVIRILIAENNIVHQKVAASLLKNIGFENIDIADNGELAFIMAKKIKYDLILMDCQMPIMSSFESTVLIRDSEKLNKLSRTPIIATTANTMVDDREKCLSSGMDDYLTKPIRTDTLSECLSYWLSIPSHGTINNGSKPEHISSINEELSEKAILDMQTMDSLKILMEEDFSELLQSYLDDAPKLLADIKNSSIHADMEVLERAAHTLKSSSENIGGKRLGFISMKIETIAKQGDLARYSMIISDLEIILTETIAAINNYQFQK